jgi:hypothetical protein
MPAASIARPAALVLLSLFLCSPAHAAETKSSAKIDFERHVMGLFGKMGCNAAACHGSFQGKGGFRLSLFGYDPDLDYASLTRDNQGRRINLSDPDNSLLLLKATGAIDHGGLRRFAKGSWQYQMLRDWITSGMARNEGSGAVKSITVTPSEIAVKKSGDAAQLSVKAVFSDDSTEDITALCDYRSNDEIIARVGTMGNIETRQAGDTAVIVSYRGNIIPVRVLVPMTTPPNFQYPKTVEVNYLDRIVQEKLKRLNMAPADLSDDAEFLRRITIDTIGSLPSPADIRAFLADKDPKKREKKIDELLKHPLHAALWATKFCDITGNNTQRLEQPNQLKPKLSQMWHDWFRKRVADNMPYDEIVKGVLTATSRDDMKPEEFIKYDAKITEEIGKGFTTSYADHKSLDLFWRRQQQPAVEIWGEQTAVAFLGVRLECAQCHKHPFDRWTQNDYWGYANLFASVSVGTSPEAKKEIDEANAEIRKKLMGKNANQARLVREVFVGGPARGKPNPQTGKLPSPKALGGPEISAAKGKDARAALFDWMRSPENPFFARSFVNRVWGHYFGIGIVHPVDDFSLANPSSNDKLLDALAKDFVESKFDIKKLERTILLSRTYQQTSTRNPTNRLDNRSYARSYVRPLMAEVVFDVLNDALGSTDPVGNDGPPGARAIEIGATTVATPQLREAFRIFGRSPRTLACDCERATEPTVANKLYLMADPNLQNRLLTGKTRIKTVLADKKSDAEVIEELFLSSLSRFPTKEEQDKALEHMKSATSKQTACNDILWALINTTEFIFNH